MSLHRLLLRPFSVASLGFLAFFTVQAQFIQQGEKLTGTLAVGAAGQGGSVALSADGNTAVVGGPADNSGTGAVWVFTRTSGVWSQQGSKLVGTGAVGNAHQGSSVAISDDGNTVIVGGPDDNSGAGAIWIFTRTDGAWSQLGNKIVGTGAVGNANQGRSVALSPDGNTVIVGGPGDNSEAGAVWVFIQSNCEWIQEGGKLIGTEAVGNASQGRSVALSADGNTAIVGGNGDNSFIGASWVFTRTSGVWSQQGSKLVGTGIGMGGNSSQGQSVALSADGNTAIVGGPGDNFGINFSGAVWVFTRSNGEWSQQGNKLIGEGRSGYTLQGGSVDVSADGNIVIVGGDADHSGTGASWIFTRTNGVWSQLGSKLVGTGYVGITYQGRSVALSADGNTAIVGGPSDNSDAGAMWVFTGTPLPIQLSRFTAKVLSESGVRLEWVTLSETNNYGFEVQRSQGTQQRFQMVPNGFVPGHGTTIQEHQYAYTDSTVTSGIWSYRLRQIDLDGSEHYNEPTNVAVKTEVGEGALPTEFSLNQNYPNPFNPTTKISYQISVVSEVKLVVYDLLGREAVVLVNEKKAPGSYQVPFDASGLASGVYVYMLTAGHSEQTRKMIAIK